MAVLSDADRAATMREWVRDAYRDATANMSTEDIRAAINAVDDWTESNQASFNTALPEPFKSTATAKQKAQMLSFVALKRTGVL